MTQVIEYSGLYLIDPVRFVFLDHLIGIINHPETRMILLEVTGTEALNCN